VNYILRKLWREPFVFYFSLDFFFGTTKEHDKNPQLKLQVLGPKF